MPVGFVALPLLGRAHLDCEIALALPFEHPRLAAAASLTGGQLKAQQNRQGKHSV